MGHLIITNRPVGGINLDDENHAVADTDCRDALNLRNSYTYINIEKTATGVKGNVLVSYPLSGKHKCLGCCEDKQERTILYFLWSSADQHKILRYYPEKTSPTAPYGVIELVQQYNWGWTTATKIIDAKLVKGTLLYWLQPEPRKINVIKGNNTHKLKSWNIYGARRFKHGSATTITLTIRDMVTNTIITTQVFNISIGNTIEDVFATMETGINTGPNSARLKADACDCHLNIIELEVNRYRLEISGGVSVYKIIPDNWYGTSLVDRFFDACKYPPPMQPVPTYRQDGAKNYNYVRKRVFQFRLEYHYDDFEPSALGPISQIAINNIVCNDAQSELYNYIDVDFNDADLLNPLTWVVLKRISVCVREHNIGQWSEVERLEICDFYDIHAVLNLFVAHYRFYNDVVSNGINSVLQAKLYDKMPLEANAQALVENKIVYAGVLENHNPPECLEAEVKPVFQDETGFKKGNKIQVYVKVYNPLFTADSLSPADIDSRAGGPNLYNCQNGIFHNISRTDTDPGGNFPFFGGLTHEQYTGSGVFGIIAGMEDVYDQRIPEGGFHVYLAGTNIWGTTRQVPIGFPVTSQGALIASDTGLINEIGQFLEGALPVGQLFSVVELENIPDGTYVIRMSSPWCSYGDKLQKGGIYDLSRGYEWHRTSANIWGVFSDVGAWSVEHEITITVSGGVLVNAGTFVVADLADAWDGDKNPHVIGYLYDANGVADANTLGTQGIAVEKAFVLLGNGAGTIIDDSSCFTDHNGYFYMGRDATAGGQFIAYQVNNPAGASTPAGWRQIKDPDINSYYVGNLQNLIDGTLRWSGGYADDDAFKDLIVFCDTDEARKGASTVIKGRVIDQDNNPVPGVSVVYEGGRVTQTDQLGNFEIIAWGDMIGTGPNLNTPYDSNNRVVDSLIISAEGFCTVVYPGGQIETVDISVFGLNAVEQENTPPYSPTSIINVGDIEVTLSNEEIYKARKRGGSYLVGIRYYDQEGRLCSVSTNPDLNIYIPFLTEDLNQYYPIDFPSAGTYRRGRAQLQWEVFSKPPKFAFTYQWMITQNLTQSKFLQWAVNEVKYIVKTNSSDDPSINNELVTTYGNFDATHIKLSLRNITDYYRLNNDSQVSYEWTAGDVIYLICDRIFNYFEGLIQFEAVSFEAPGWVIIKNIRNDIEFKSGMIIETFSPRAITENRIYFEMGETYKCTAPGQDNNEHSVISGTFTSGDTYWRGRSIPVFDGVTNFSKVFNGFIEDAAISDFYKSTDSDIGRIGTVDPDFRQIYRPTIMRVSGNYIPDTMTNGLSTFENLDDPELDRIFGPIRRLVLNGIVLISVHENRAVSNYVAHVLAQNIESGILATSKGFLPDSRPLLGDFGTQNPESVTDYDGYVYGFDAYRGVVWRYASNGFEEISRYKMRAYFAAFIKKPIWEAPAIFDPQYKEYILTIFNKEVFYPTGVVPATGSIRVTIVPQPVVAIGDPIEITFTISATGERRTEMGVVSSLTNGITINGLTVESGNAVTNLVAAYRGAGVTVAFSEPKNRWTTRYSFTPECYGAVREDMVSLKDGTLWVHDNNNLYNNFYGTQYTTKLKVISSGDIQVKMWLACFIHSYQTNQLNNWKVVSITNRAGQLSSISNASLVKKEQFWHSEYKRDTTTVGVNFPILNGRRLRSPNLVVELENDYTDEFDLISFNSAVEVSQRNGN